MEALYHADIKQLFGYPENKPNFHLSICLQNSIAHAGCLPACDNPP
jgi:hypothetical protein